jgi:stearoyl-CoA desaturase (delta-9 desaturase)
MKREIRQKSEKTLLVSKDKEVFSTKHLIIIISMHVLAVGAFFFFSYNNLVAWLIAQIYFGTIGASLGLHRLYSHRTYVPKWKLLKWLIGFSATLCFQGGPIFWAAVHRVHHLFSGNYGDPHSASRGFFWAHMGWLFYKSPNGFSYLRARGIVQDLRKDNFIRFLEKYALQINVLFLFILLVGCIAGRDIGLFFWIGPLRIVTGWHLSWLTNSYSHGAHFSRANVSPNRLRNSNFIALAMGGDGDHDFHHRHPSSIRHTDRRFYLEYGFWILAFLKRLGAVNYRDPVLIQGPVQQVK